MQSFEERRHTSDKYNPMRKGTEELRNLLEQLPALIGVLLGALGTYSVTALTERKRWQRQLTVRWDERRVIAYMEYAHAIKKSSPYA